ncbi:LytR/AlgR family response regulator transcription factor [Alteromonas sp. H39]|uniref:LytR/AlgR family response regulator transcription factor n=1 Tax=Alteromonas sp. H39 TaxID=3389876 RepID=UPI0039E121DD
MKKVTLPLEVGLSRSQTALFSGLAEDITFASRGAGVGQLALVAVIVGAEKHVAASLMDALSAHEDIVHTVCCNTVLDARPVLISYPSAVIFASQATITALGNLLCDGMHCVVTGSSNGDALSAFQVMADGFLQLPIHKDQLHCCLEKVTQNAKRQLFRDQYQRVSEGLCKQFGVNQEALAAMLRRQCASRKRAGVVGLRSGNEWCCLQPDDICWIEAAGDYMCVYTSGENHIVRSTMTELLRRLDNNNFLHANRSVVVNLSRVRRIMHQGPGVHYLEMDTGTMIKISRRCYMACWQNQPLD